MILLRLVCKSFHLSLTNVQLVTILFLFTEDQLRLKFFYSTTVNLINYVSGEKTERPHGAALAAADTAEHALEPLQDLLLPALPTGNDELIPVFWKHVQLDPFDFRPLDPGNSHKINQKHKNIIF